MASKIIITCLIILACFFLLFMIWNLNVRKSLQNIFNEFFPGKKLIDAIETFNPNIIYQRGNKVGEVVGDVEESSNKFIFKKLVNTNIDPKQSIQFRGKECSIQGYKSFKGADKSIVINDTGVVSTEYKNVFEDVECIKK
jgi:hypothetical protein